MTASRSKKSDNCPFFSLIGGIIRFLKDHTLSITAVAGALGFYLTPLKDVIYHHIWDEKAVIAIISESDTVRVQDELKVYITVLPNSPVGISEGLATLEFSNDKLALISKEAKAFATPSIRTPTVLFDGRSIAFAGMSAGNAQITVVITTRYRQFQGEKQVIVLGNDPGRRAMATDPSRRPSERNFSGEWIVRVGATNGDMLMLDKLGNITGSYSLDNNIHGVISGVRDGGIFYASFYRQSPEVKWEVSAHTRLNDGFLLIEGKATLQKIGSGKWVATDQTDSFMATAQLLDR